MEQTLITIAIIVISPFLLALFLLGLYIAVVWFQFIMALFEKRVGKTSIPVTDWGKLKPDERMEIEKEIATQSQIQPRTSQSTWLGSPNAEEEIRMNAEKITPPLVQHVPQTKFEDVAEEEIARDKIPGYEERG